MPKMTPEAKKLSATIQALGVPRKSMRVSSSIGKEDYFAHVSINNREHEKLALDHIDHLNNRGVHVTTMDYDCGHRRLIGMSDAFGKGEHKVLGVSSSCPSCTSPI